VITGGGVFCSIALGDFRAWGVRQARGQASGDRLLLPRRSNAGSWAEVGLEGHQNVRGVDKGPAGLSRQPRGLSGVPEGLWDAMLNTLR
jgi:hypothetical protein